MRVMTPALALLVSLAGEARGQYVTEHCDQAQIQVLTSAISSAEFLLDNATKYLGRGGVNAEPRPFLLYFGDLRNIAVVAAKIAAMNLELLVTTYNCADDGWCRADGGDEIDAWADTDAATIHFCESYWTMPVVSVDLWSGADQRSIVVHELSHLKPAPVTVNMAGKTWSSPLDVQQAARIQAVAMPTYAEAYQYFAWHLPLWQAPGGGCAMSSRRGASEGAALLVIGFLGSVVARRRRRMRVGLGVLLIVGVTVVVAVAIGRGSAQDHRPLPLPLTPAAELATVPLKCEVEAPAQARLGGPLTVTVRLTNTGAEPLSFYRQATPFTPRWYPFEVAHGDGQRVPARWDKANVLFGPPTAKGYRRIGAGETLVGTVDVAEQWTLRPGTLSITQNALSDVFTGEFDPQRAILHKQPARLDCPVVRVEVAPASD